MNELSRNYGGDNCVRQCAVVNHLNCRYLYHLHREFFLLCITGAFCECTNRIVLAWNSLSDTVVTASSVNAFRQHLNTVNLKKFLIVG